MSDDLEQLERDVETTRARLTSHLATLRAPDTYSGFADGIRQTAIDTKDSIVEQARTRTRSAIDEFVDSLKARAAANPAAVLVIGAGVAWHLIRKPPIVTALVGGGLVSLLKTPAAPAGRSDEEYLEQAKAKLRVQASDMSQAASDAGRQAAGYAVAKASDVGQQVFEKASDAGHKSAARAAEMGHQAMDAVKTRAAELTAQARDAVESVRDRVTGAPSATSGAGSDEAYFQEDVGLPPPGYRPNGGASWDKLLLGAAGVAVAAALLTALRRRGDEMQDEAGDGRDAPDHRPSGSMSQAPQVGMM